MPETNSLKTISVVWAAERWLDLPTPSKEDTMKKLMAISAVLLVLACQDHNPVQPAPDLTPELALAQARGGPGNVVKMVPHKGTGTMWFVAEGDESPCYDVDGWEDTTFCEGEGTMTHLGRSEFSFTNCMGAGDRWQRLLLLFRVTARTANGDLLYGEGLYYDPERPYRLIVYPDLSWESRNIRIVGGTGRFKNAVGWYSCFGDNIFAPRFNWTCEGEISSVGSSK